MKSRAQAARCGEPTQGIGHRTDQRVQIGRSGEEPRVIHARCRAEQRHPLGVPGEQVTALVDERAVTQGQRDQRLRYEHGLETQQASTWLAPPACGAARPSSTRLRPACRDVRGDSRLRHPRPPPPGPTPVKRKKDQSTITRPHRSPPRPVITVNSRPRGRPRSAGRGCRITRARPAAANRPPLFI